jgi:cytochrome c oxidase subunit 3
MSTASDLVDAGGSAGVAQPAGGEPHHEALPYDPTGSRIGMWLFLFTEILFFGGLFIAYAVYLSAFMRGFQLGSAELNIAMGALNTVVLLTSSLTMALSIAALQRGNVPLSQKLLNATLLLAFAFLVVKSFEWGAKFEHHLYPGSPFLLDRTKGEIVFFGLYFSMTGLHALHVIIGIFIILWAKRKIARGRVTPERSVLLDNVGLYWHLVDLVWIFLFPLFYLLH